MIFGFENFFKKVKRCLDKRDVTNFCCFCTAGLYGRRRYVFGIYRSDALTRKSLKLRAHCRQVMFFRESSFETMF